MFDERRSAAPSEAGRVPVDRLLRPEEIARAWQLDVTTVRRLFLGVPGVLKLGRKVARGKRSYVTLRIPVEVAQRVFMERSK
jgi:hypothetical protein